LGVARSGTAAKELVLGSSPCLTRIQPIKYSCPPRSGPESVFTRPRLALSGLVSQRAFSARRDFHEHLKSRSILTLARLWPGCPCASPLLREAALRYLRKPPSDPETGLLDGFGSRRSKRSCATSLNKRDEHAPMLGATPIISRNQDFCTKLSTQSDQQLLRAQQHRLGRA
jgi:hypothetical protein